MASAIADEKQLERQLLQQRSQAEDWEKRAVLAVQERKDDLAQPALVANRSSTNTSPATSTVAGAARLDRAAQGIAARSHPENRGSAAQDDILITRAKRAEAQQRIQTTLSTSRDTSAFEAFDRMAKKVDQIEAQADAEQEINQLDAADQSLEREFKQLEGGGTSADNLLEDLKRKMGQIEDKSAETESHGKSAG